MIKLLVALAFVSIALGAVNPTVLQALEDFYHGTTNPNTWNTGSPWLVGDPCANSWQGVSCQGDNIDELMLGNTGMTGTLSPSLSKITTLRSIYLYSNALTGTLPSCWSSLNNLRTIHLYNNFITGTLPDSWGTGMNSLTNLDLGNNKLGGTIPASYMTIVGRTNSPGQLQIGWNNLCGTVPPNYAANLVGAALNLLTCPVSCANQQFDSCWKCVSPAAGLCACGNGICYGETPASCPSDCYCGNGVCEVGEDSSCVDCTSCGNGVCDHGETYQNCNADCAGSCGNSCCDAGESPQNCPFDCPCGDSLCDQTETFVSCPEDCLISTCGNSVCDATESLSSCPADCKCGNNQCESGETFSTCPNDCTLATCGNELCDGSETSMNCPNDCRCGNFICEADETFNSCYVDCRSYNCGNNQCDWGEGYSICPHDCIPGCGDKQCSATETYAICKIDCQLTSCGNNQCDPMETFALCPHDCTNPLCGNGVCDSEDDCDRDCKYPRCGNYQCDREETNAACPNDCWYYNCGNGICDFQEQQGWVPCPYDCPVCGDGFCDELESINNSCPAECDVGSSPSPSPSPSIQEDPSYSASVSMSPSPSYSPTPSPSISPITPVLVIPSDTTVLCSQSTSISNLGQATMTPSSIAPSYQVVFSDQPLIPGGSACTQTLFRTWTATSFIDGSSLRATQQITIVDVEPPVINVPAVDLDVVCNIPDVIQAIYTLWKNSNGGAVASDCNAVTWITPTESTVPDFTCGSSNTVTFYAQDSCGYQVSQTATFRINPPILNIPDSRYVQCGGCTTPACLGTAQIQPSGYAVVSYTDQNLLRGCPGKILRTWEATTNSGDVIASETQIIWVDDNLPPVVILPPLDKQVRCSTDYQTLFDTWLASHGDLLAVDCNPVTIVNYFDNVPRSDIVVSCPSQTTVTFVAFDVCSNSVKKTATFSVVPV